MNFSELIGLLFKINQELREQTIRAVNLSVTLRNWFFGFYIVEFEQNGKDRAEYGEALLANISTEMKSRAIAHTDERELRRYRQFYIAYPAAALIIAPNDQIRGFLAAIPIRGTVSPDLQIPDLHYFNLFNRVSYSHLAELARLDEPLKRLFYEMECVKGSWSVRELRRQIGSLLYERTGLSKNKEKLLALAHSKSETHAFPDFIRDPYIFEFIGLKPQEVLPEKEMEQALLDHLLQFLLELGKSFALKRVKSELSLITNIILSIWSSIIEYCIVMC